MGFFKKLFGQSDDHQEDEFDINDYLDDSDDDVDVEDYSDDDEADSSDSSNKSYSIAKVRVVGFDTLDEADKDYVREKLGEDTHVYLRYDFEAPSKQQLLQVCRHSNILGYIEPNKVDIILSYLHDGKIGAIVVSKIKSKDFTVSIDLQVYYEDPHGEEYLPYYPFEGRQLDVIEVDLWTGQEDWSRDWFMNIFTDELCYKYLNLYDGTVDEDEIKDVDWQLAFWINSYLDGTCITRQGGELYLNRLKTDCAKKVLVKRMESYLENKGLHFADKEVFGEDENDEVEGTSAPSDETIVKQYMPTYEISYIDEQGKRQNKTIKNANFSTFVAGIKYRDNWEELVEKLSDGIKLRLKTDPNNEYDSNAIAVYNGEEHLGYIPKKDIPAVRWCMDGDELVAEIEYVDEDYVSLIIPATFQKLVDCGEDELKDVRFSKTERKKYDFGVYQEARKPISKQEFLEGMKQQKEDL